MWFKPMYSSQASMLTSTMALGVNTSLKFYQSGKLADSNNVRQEKRSSNLYSISFLDVFPSLQWASDLYNIYFCLYLQLLILLPISTEMFPCKNHLVFHALVLIQTVKGCRQYLLNQTRVRKAAIFSTVEAWDLGKWLEFYRIKILQCNV